MYFAQHWTMSMYRTVVTGVREHSVADRQPCLQLQDRVPSVLCPWVSCRLAVQGFRALPQRRARWKRHLQTLRWAERRSLRRDIRHVFYFQQYAPLSIGGATRWIDARDGVSRRFELDKDV